MFDKMKVCLKQDTRGAHVKKKKKKRIDINKLAV